MENIHNDDEDQSFRDSIGTINESGKRNWVYAQQPKGKLYNKRTIVSVFYLILFFWLPFVRIDGDPFFLFNILERRFIFFGVTFWPQDFFIFGLGMLVFIVFVVLFTVVFGRVFCGWVCPQTIFMEMVFRRVEYWIEGDASHQRALNKAPYNAEKIIKKTAKHISFFLISFLIANTFLAYVIGTDELFKIIQEPIKMHVGGFTALLLFTGIFYAVYSWFREQVCLIVCPYGRLQGVMTDRNSILVAYDYLRGEPRGKFTKNQEKPKGDCIDCFQCVKVCPVAIDIRNGTQLECNNCTACIDACDHMMESVGSPKGLIRYASEEGIAKGEKLKFTTRIKAYTVVLIVLMGILAALLITRRDVDVTILRTPGMLFQEHDSTHISNLYNIKLLNKTHKDISVKLHLEAMKGEIEMIGKNIVIKKVSKAESSFFIILPKKAIHDRKTPILVNIYSGKEKLQTVKTTFLGPITLKH
jgi:cytochrome c oxidase accessory protein FixG